MWDKNSLINDYVYYKEDNVLEKLCTQQLYNFKPVLDFTQSV